MRTLVLAALLAGVVLGAPIPPPKSRAVVWPSAVEYHSDGEVACYYSFNDDKSFSSWDGVEANTSFRTFGTWALKDGKLTLEEYRLLDDGRPDPLATRTYRWRSGRWQTNGRYIRKG